MKIKYFLLVPFDLIKHFENPVDRYLRSISDFADTMAGSEKEIAARRNLVEHEKSVLERSPFVVYKEPKQDGARTIYGFYEFDVAFPLPAFAPDWAEVDGKKVYPWSEMVVSL